MIQSNPLILVESLPQLQPAFQKSLTLFSITTDIVSVARFRNVIGFYLIFFSELHLDIVVSKHGFLVTFSDLDFDKSIFNRTIAKKSDLVLVDVTNEEPNLLMQYLYCFNAILTAIKTPF